MVVDLIKKIDLNITKWKKMICVADPKSLGESLFVLLT